MNMLQQHRRNPTRRRAAPKKYEDEKFVCGSVDRYQHSYDGHTGQISGNENYYTSQRGNKFSTLKWNDRGRYTAQLVDFPESLLEFTSIWRDLNLVIPSELIPNIAAFLNLKNIDKQLIIDDDEFIAAEDNESKFEEISESEADSENEWNSEEETDDDEEEWSEHSDDDD